MVKEVLLGVPSKAAEVGRGEFTELGRGNFAAPREVALAQHAFDPDINRESPDAFESKEQDTVGDLFAHPGKTLEFGASGFVVQPADFLELDLAAGDHARGAEKIPSPIAEGTGPQVRLV